MLKEDFAELHFTEWMLQEINYAETSKNGKVWLRLSLKSKLKMVLSWEFSLSVSPRNQHSKFVKLLMLTDKPQNKLEKKWLTFYKKKQALKI